MVVSVEPGIRRDSPPVGGRCARSVVHRWTETRDFGADSRLQENTGSIFVRLRSTPVVICFYVRSEVSVVPENWKPVCFDGQ